MTRSRKSRTTATRTLVTTVLLLSDASCSVLVDAERPQCQATADCLRLGAAFQGSTCVQSLCVSDPAWTCLIDPPDANSDGPYRIEFHLIDLVSRKPWEGVEASLCRKLDTDCAAPLGDVAKSDANGALSLDVPTGFDGYVAFHEANLFPTLFFFGGPVTNSKSLPPTPLPTPLTVANLTSQVGSPLLDRHGIVVMQTNDCHSRLAQGVSVSTANGDEVTLPFYWVGGLPTTRATMTDGAGFGGLVNVPAGTATVTGTLVASDRRLNTTSVLVRSGYLTFASVVPLGN